jgi:long-chain-fatty-acid--CoA ligase ACSBG
MAQVFFLCRIREHSEACRYVADHSRSNVIVVENHKQLVKILEIRSQLSHLKAIVQYTGSVDPKYKDDVRVPHASSSQGVLSWEDFMRVGADMPDFELGWRINPQTAASCCTLIYTSGTTGDPKVPLCGLLLMPGRHDQPRQRHVDHGGPVPNRQARL